MQKLEKQEVALYNIEIQGEICTREIRQEDG
jgi:hypothetical protein